MMLIDELYNKVLGVLQLLSTFGLKIWQLMLTEFKLGDINFTLLEIAFGAGFLIAMVSILVKSFV